MRVGSHSRARAARLSRSLPRGPRAGRGQGSPGPRCIAGLRVGRRPRVTAPARGRPAVERTGSTPPSQTLGPGREAAFVNSEG